MKVAFIVLIFFLHFGVITLVLAQNALLGPQLAAGLILTGIIFTASPLTRKIGFNLTSIFDMFPALFFIWAVFVSFYSNNYIYDYGNDNWLTYSYVLVPILFYYLLRGISASFLDIVRSVVIIGIVSCSIVFLDSLVNISILDEFQRYTNLSGVRRITILKNECALALLLLIANVYTSKNVAATALKFSIPISIMLFVIALRFESRLALAAVVVSTVLFIIFRKVSNIQQVLLLIFSSFAAIPLAFFLFEKYISPILQSGLEKYIIENNVQRRVDAADFFYRHFSETSGLGFGLMTLNKQANNFQSQAIVSDYFILSDTGILGALYQYGYVGFSLVVIATTTLIVRFVAVGRSEHPSSPAAFMIACFTLAFILQPIPMNFFSLNWTVLLGSCLWYAARRSAWERRVLAL